MTIRAVIVSIVGAALDELGEVDTVPELPHMR